VLQAFRENIARIFDTGSSGRLLIYSFGVGIVGGLGAAVFYSGLLWFQSIALGEIVGYVPRELVQKELLLSCNSPPVGG
jgi:hypothetical protein